MSTGFTKEVNQILKLVDRQPVPWQVRRKKQGGHVLTNPKGEVVNIPGNIREFRALKNLMSELRRHGFLFADALAAIEEEVRSRRIATEQRRSEAKTRQIVRRLSRPEPAVSPPPSTKEEPMTPTPTPATEHPPEALSASCPYCGQKVNPYGMGRHKQGCDKNPKFLPLEYNDRIAQLRRLAGVTQASLARSAFGHRTGSAIHFVEQRKRRVTFKEAKRIMAALAPLLPDSVHLLPPELEDSAAAAPLPPPIPEELARRAAEVERVHEAKKYEPKAKDGSPAPETATPTSDAQAEPARPSVARAPKAQATPSTMPPSSASLVDPDVSVEDVLALIFPHGLPTHRGLLSEVGAWIEATETMLATARGLGEEAHGS